MMQALLIKALQGKNTNRPPVWLMRQAGRYLPEYQDLRKKHSLWTLFHTPHLATKITMMPIERFSFDAAILFSDILLIAEACGKSVEYLDAGGPRIAPLTKEEIASLRTFDVRERLSYVFETIQRIKGECPVPLIGFCGGPFTVACYMLEEIKTWMKKEPVWVHQLLRQITQVTIEALHFQIEAGVDALQIFDSWADRLDTGDFHRFCLPYLNEIVEALRDRIPVILFCRKASLRTQDLVPLRPTAISLTEEKPMSLLRQEIPKEIALQGNLPPSLLLRTQEEIEGRVHSLVQSMEGEQGFIVNLSHGILPQTPVENVEAFVKACRKSIYCV
jgi:uroporphyrinogen decarboxylase